MKTLIQESGVYKLYAEFRNCENPNNLVELRLLSQWDAARNPDELHVKLSLILTPEERKRLKDFL